jgi:nucleotide-binding universal stress UspA family protein
MSDQRAEDSHRIVVGVDGSPSSKEALRWAARQASMTGARVQAVIAWNLPVITGGYAWPPVGGLAATDFGELARQVLTDAVSGALGPGTQAELIVRQGSAPGVLIEAAAGADLLVVGSRGHGGFTEALLGSVSQHCVHHAACPVVVIRSAPAAAEAGVAA